MSNSKCSNCGGQVAGKFCPECGTPTGSLQCRSCGGDVKSGARFCAGCGTPVAGGKGRVPSMVSNRLPWIVTTVSIVLLVVVAVAKSGISGSPQTGTEVAQSSPVSPRATTDLSTMSPREAANRLFNRVMAAAERGDTSEVLSFMPMAIQAYQMFGPLDADAHYDLGMIFSIGSDPVSALAQADTIEQSFPNHLLARVIRATVAQLTDDEESLSRAYGEFLAAFEAEIALDRSEYRAHRRTVDLFRVEAIANTQ